MAQISNYFFFNNPITCILHEAFSFMGTTLTYIYYVAGLFLAILPIIIEFIIRKKGAPKKPTWYLWTVIVIIVFLLSVGGYKVHCDDKEKATNDSLKHANDRTINKLNNNVDSITKYLGAIRDSDKQFQDNLLDKYHIKRDRITNTAIFVGNIDNKHTNYTNIKKADNVDIH